MSDGPRWPTAEPRRLAAAAGRARHRRHAAEVGRRAPARRTSRSARRCTTRCTAPVDAGAHVVLASGRSPHGMTRIADLLDLHADGAEPALGRGQQRRGGLPLPAARGASTRRPSTPRRRCRPCWSTTRTRWSRSRSAASATASTGHFPDGELTGEMIIAEVDDLVAGPVSRVIIRDPDATADDFVALAERLGLHGTDYVVGWTAWLDLAPVGVSKASGLAHVADELGVDAGRRARDRRRPQRHRDAALGRPRRGDGPGGRGGAGGRRRRDRHRLRRRRRHRARPLVPRAACS